MKQHQQTKGTVLITGGAGFIGSHTADELYAHGYNIRILDNLDPTTHYGKWPDYLKKEYEKILGDVRKKEDLQKALTGVDFVIHLAAQMNLTTDFANFFNTNVTSTALLYEIIINNKLPIKKVIVASSQFVYGEGKWQCNKHGVIFPHLRTLEQLENKQWNPKCPWCTLPITKIKNTEDHQDPPNQYAISKYTQELITLKLGRNYNIPSVAMRYSIVHGSRQSLKNAYSGALRVFTMKILHGEKIATFEDNLMQRDYVSVYDVAKANRIVLESNKANYENFNVGGDTPYSVKEIANIIAKNLKKTATFEDQIEFRLGDVRHAISDTSKLKKLGWNPKFNENQNISEYLNWVSTQKIDINNLHNIELNLRSKGVIFKTK